MRYQKGKRRAKPKPHGLNLPPLEVKVEEREIILADGTIYRGPVKMVQCAGARNSHRSMTWRRGGLYLTSFYPPELGLLEKKGESHAH